MIKYVTRRQILQGGSVLGLSALGLGLAGCGGSSGGQGKIRYVGYVESQQQLKATRTAIEQYQKAHSKVTVTTEFSDFSSYVDKITTQISGGNPPDMMSANVDILSEYAGRGVLRELDSYNPGQINLADYAKGSVGAAQFDGKLYGIPNDVVGPTVIYNTDMLHQLGLKMPSEMCTWDDLANTAKAVAKAAGKGTYGIEDGSAAHIALDVYLRPNKKIFFAKDGKLGFEASDLIRWLNYWKDLREAGAIPPAATQAQSSSGDLSKTLLIRNKAAMLLQLTDSWFGLQALTPHKLGLHMLPNGFSKADLRQQNFVYAGNMTCISTKSHSASDIIALIKYLHTDPQGSSIFYKDTGIIPASAEARQTVLSSGSKTTRTLINYLAPLIKNSAEPRHSGPTEINDILQRTSDAVAFGRQSVQDAATGFFKDAAQVYKNR